MFADSVNTQVIDDFFWQSGASTGTWLGELRCATMMPVSDQSVAFSRAPALISVTASIQNSTQAVTANQARYMPFTAPVTGTIGSATLNMQVASTGNFKCTMYSSSAGSPATALGSATPISAPGVGNTTFTFGTPVSVTGGTQYFIAFDGDTSSGNYGINSGQTNAPYWSSATYASFPTNNPSITGTTNPIASTLTITPSPSANYSAVNEAQQDGLTSYVYDQNPGDADFYGVSPLVPAGASVKATTTRAYMQKSDVGTRTASVQLKSGVLTPTTWNPSDLFNVTLSGSNLTASCSGSGGVRGATSRSSGKYYWECTWTINTNNLASGLAIGSASLTSPGTGSVTVRRLSGDIFVETTDTFSPLNSGNPIPQSSVIGCAVDLSAQLIWFRLAPSGNWNGSGTANPATATGGISISTISGALFPMMSGLTGDIVVANFGGSAFSGAVPAGFTAGFTAGSQTTVASPTLTLSNSGWQWASRMDLTDPNTSAAWTVAAVNAAQIGPKVIA